MAPTWMKSPQQLVDLFDAVVPAGDRVERRQMFGYPCAFVNGNMFTGLHQNHLVLRLDEPARLEFLQLEGATIFEPMAGRPMREYVCAPAQLLEDRQALGVWLTRSLTFVGAFPPKDRKPAARKAASPAAAKRKKATPAR